MSHNEELLRFVERMLDTETVLPPSTITFQREIIQDALAEKHVVCPDAWYTCPAATYETDGGACVDEDRVGAPCECGRDERINLLLKRIAFRYASVGAEDFREEWKL